MKLGDDFKELCSVVTPDENELERWEKRVKRITKKLNKIYYDLENDEDNSFIVGSVGRSTSLNKLSDYDVIFDLPKEVYDKYDNYEVNGQSALLQKIKGYLKEIHPNTKIRGDGQVVVIEFSDGAIELVPGFQQVNKSFKYPDSNDGGKWKITNPLPEISTCIQCDLDTDQNFSDFSRILRSWKNTVGFKFKGLLIDTMVFDFFEENQDEKASNYDNYFNLLKNLFKYLKEQDSERSYWYALGSNQQISNDDKGTFIKKAKKAHNILDNYDSNKDDINKLLRSLLGKNFPKKESQKNVAAFEMFDFDDKEEFIEDKFLINIQYNLTIDCIVEQNGWRPTSLREMIKNRQILKKNKKLTFNVIYSDFPEYINRSVQYFWKVKNEGDEAEKRSMTRGEITKGSNYWEESTDFKGNHYVECYAVADNLVIAKSKIAVPIQT